MAPQAGVAFDLASFKNSREYARKATTTATTSDITIAANTALLPTLLMAVDTNRTYATLYNRHATDSFKYFYRHATDPAPTVAQILAEGFEIIANGAIDLESPEEVWAVSTTVNPIPADMDIGDG